jgi:hypothetical protein
MRGLPYSPGEIAHILAHPEEDHGALADDLNELFHSYNQGTRSRDGVAQWTARKRHEVVLRVVKIPRPLYDAVGGSSLDIEQITIVALTILREAMQRKAQN